MSRGLGAEASLRARRWDVLVLGTAIPGLVAATRLAKAGQRVLIAEEEAAARTPALLREPFLLPGGFGDGAVDATLRAVGAPLIERRSLEHDEVAYQVLLPETRAEVGGAQRTAHELVAWGLAKPEEAQAFVAAVERGSGQALEQLLEGEMLRRGLRGIGRSPSAGEIDLTLPPLSPEVEAWCQLQLRGLSGLGATAPTPEASLRLLGSGLSGASRFAKPDDGLRALLRRRLQGLHAEFRTVGCPFQLIELGEHPGIARVGPQDVWLGRALVLNAPASSLATAMRGWDHEVPAFLDGPKATHRRLCVHLRALREVVPEPLAPRAILAGPGGEAGPEAITLAQYPSERGSRFAELVASAVVPDLPEEEERQAAVLEEAVRGLIPFSEGRLKAMPLTPRPLWDDDFAAPDPEGRQAWPAPLEIRAGGRRPVFRLAREAVAGLGVEGEMVLGAQAGDLIAEELS